MGMLQQGVHPESLHLKSEFPSCQEGNDNRPGFVLIKSIFISSAIGTSIFFLLFFYGNAPIFPISLLIGPAFRSSGKGLIENHLLGSNLFPNGFGDAAFGISQLVPCFLWDADGKGWKCEYIEITGCAGSVLQTFLGSDSSLPPSFPLPALFQAGFNPGGCQSPPEIPK